MDVGMLFQHRGPATEKARSPKQVFDFRTLDRPSPQITDVLPLSMSTLQRSIILDSLAQHHVETCSTNFIVICVFNFLNTADAFCFAKVFRLFKIYTRK